MPVPARTLQVFVIALADLPGDFTFAEWNALYGDAGGVPVPEPPAATLAIGLVAARLCAISRRFF